VRVDPYVIPKRALTGSVFERVDTRVLQVIYKITAVPAGLVPWCGQQVEVFIEDARPPRRADQRRHLFRSERTDLSGREVAETNRPEARTNEDLHFAALRREATPDLTVLAFAKRDQPPTRLGPDRHRLERRERSGLQSVV
jgi:hypothetical protein